MSEKDEADLQSSIFDKTRVITKLLKQSELSLRKLVESEDGVGSNSDDQIKKNIMSLLASRMRDLTQSFKQNEKDFYIKVKEFHGDDDTLQKQKTIDDQYFQQMQI